MLLWIAILLLLDSGIALMAENRIAKWAPRFKVRPAALIEAGVAMALAAAHFWLKR